MSKYNFESMMDFQIKKSVSKSSKYLYLYIDYRDVMNITMHIKTKKSNKFKLVKKIAITNVSHMITAVELFESMSLKIKDDIYFNFQLDI